MRYSYKPQGVCAREIQFDLEDGKVSNIAFFGGCNGNLKAISKLCEGMEAEKIIEILQGNDCGGRGTSCADQFTKALAAAGAR